MRAQRLGFRLTAAGFAATSLLLAGCGGDETTDNPVPPAGPVCGDGIVNGAELCDGTHLGDATCAGEGFTAGTLTCDATCMAVSTVGCCNDACPAAGDTECNGALLRTCATQSTGCLDWTTTDCEMAGGDCDDTQSPAVCTVACVDNCPTVGDTECTGDTLRTCEAQASGCRDWTALDCTGDGNVCDDSETPAACVPACEDECTTDGEALCDGGSLSVCANADTDACLELTVTDCLATPGDICDDTAAPAVCAANGTGESCADAYWIQAFPAEFAGDDFTADYTVDNFDFGSGTDCSSTSSTGSHVDAVFRVDMEDGDELFVSDHGDIDFVMHIVAADAVNCLDTSACLASTDGNETTGITYTATSTETVYVVAEPYYSSTSTVEYELRINKISRVCGDGWLSPGEICDDGNTADGDGCSADCSTIEADYDCQPGICYPTGSGDICGAGAGGPAIPIGPGSYLFDTTGFADDYDGYGGACGTNMEGAGPDVVFSVSVPAGDIMEIRDTDSVGFDAVVVIAGDCADILGSCQSWSDIGEEASYANLTVVDTTVYFIIDGYYSGDDGVFQFTLDVRTPVCGDGVIEGLEECDDGNAADADGCSAICEVEADFECVSQPSFCFATGTGDVCATPIPITASTSFYFDTTQFADDYGQGAGSSYSACSGPDDGGFGPDAVFGVEVAAGDILHVTGSEQQFYAALVLSSDCADIEANCLHYAESSSAELHGSYFNNTGATQTIYVLVDGGYDATVAAGDIGLTFDLHTVTCGDGMIEATEECDDGDVLPNDGCSDTCTVEGGFACVNEPSVCGTLVSVTRSPALAIPDNNSAGVTDTAAVGVACTVLGITVDVGITHTWRGDLIVELTAPDGTTTVRLADETGGSNDNIIGNYPETLTPAESLSAFDTLDGQGDWTMFASDNATGDIGTLDTWGLNLICQ